MNESSVFQTGIQIEGLEKLLEEVECIRAHKKSFLISTLNNLSPVGIEVIHTGGFDSSTNVRMMPSIEKLHEIFNECYNKIDKTKGYIVIYDFGYYTNDNNYRNFIIMVSFIPDSLNIKYKMAFSTNISYILHKVGIDYHIPLHDFEKFNFDYIRQKCLLKRK